MPLLVFAGLSLAVFAAAWALRMGDRQSNRVETEVAATQCSKRLEELTLRRLNSIERVGQASSRGRVVTSRDFQAQAESALRGVGGLDAVTWVDEAGFVVCVVPALGNEHLLGSNVEDSPFTEYASRAARNSNEMQITPPIADSNGGQVFWAYYPLVKESGEANGFVGGLFPYTEMFAKLFTDESLDDYDLWIRDEHSDILSSANQLEVASQGRHIAPARLTVYNREWDLAITRNAPAWSVAGLEFPMLFLLIGLFIATSIAVALHYWIGRQTNEQRILTERAEMESRLLQSQKMEAVGRLAGGVAHDFNNLLTAILGNADLLETFSELDDQSLAAIEQIRIAGERATQLTTQLLTISRRQVVQPRVIDLNVELRTLHGVLKRLIREDIEFVESLTDDQCVVELDPGQLSQIAINLVVNAVDVMPTGGQITMHTKRLRTELNGEIRDWVVLTVEDTGAGMDEETQQRALEPFFTTKEKGKGTGLGLATVDGITTGAGGAVKIENNQPRGTRVSAWLPVSHRKLDTPAKTANAELRGGTALIVEDEPSVLTIASRILAEAGYKVIETHNGMEALERVDAGAKFDLLFTDAVMPRLGGRDLLEHLRSRNLDFIAVVTSGYPDELDADDLRRLRAAFLNKPFTEQTVREAVQAAGDLGSRVGEPV